ncbi:response regulator [Rhizorhabdus argentea]|uniref:response regulator n=1 Tax=Rhizorhabdus argentea TaxID=1387174 RepID=UPI0030EE5489
MGQSLGRALIVEDDPMLQRLLAELIEEMGYSVTSAEDAENARKAIHDREFQFLLTDLKLQNDQVAGLALATEIRTENADMRIVIVSGYPMPLDLPPETLFLQKPFTILQLQSLIGSPPS